MPEDIIAHQMSVEDRALMYRSSNAALQAMAANGAGKDVRIATIAAMRTLAHCMAGNPWGRDPQIIRMVQEMLPLYINAAIQGTKDTRIIQPFTRLPRQ